VFERDQAHPVQTEPGPPDSLRDARLQACRSAYAQRILALAGLSPGVGLASEIAAALASIPRENFVCPPPWKSITSGTHAPATSDDPALIYQDVLVPLGAGRGLNNGQPSLHALCLNALAPQKGECAVHVGAGTGYYTAMLAILVGSSGHVDAYEIEPELARRAAALLAGFPQVAVHSRSGAEAPLPACDLLYVNAAAAEPLALWLDALRPQGRLLFPLEPDNQDGKMLLITRNPDGSYPARFLCGVQFVPCAGAQNAQAARALSDALWRRSGSQVRHLHRNNQPDDSCWCVGRDWWLSTR
jgi:protein-L-isoaspartate(D-aspartate) O-methyltransferase